MRMMLIMAPLIALALTACELPDVAGLNSMPKRTQDMSDKMDKTNDAIHKQTLVAALEQIDKADNQRFTYPIPTGVMAAAKVFGEEVHADELIEFTYLRLKELEEVQPAYGMDADGYAIDLTAEQKDGMRLQLKARLSGLQAIVSFAQDEKIEAIIQTEINGHGRYEETAYKLLALRANFIRDILLKLSLNLGVEGETLSNSGMMKEAVKYLVKLDKISKLEFADQIKIDLKNDGNPDLIKFTEKQDLEGRQMTAELWQIALDKAKAGMQSYKEFSQNSTKPQNAAKVQAEVSSQEQVMATMQSYIESWRPLLP